jgi:hypothetical protein
MQKLIIMALVFLTTPAYSLCLNAYVDVAPDKLFAAEEIVSNHCQIDSIKEKSSDPDSDIRIRYSCMSAEDMADTVNALSEMGLDNFCR